MFLVNRLQDLLSMRFCLDFLWQEYLFDDALFVDDERSAESTHILASVHAFFAPYAHFLYQLLVGISDERERKLVLVYELLMRCRTIDAYANHLHTFLLQFGIMVA